MYPYRFLIGKIIFDKMFKVNHVFLKKKIHDPKYGIYTMECIYGESDRLETVHIESKIKLKMHLGKVFWSSKYFGIRKRLHEKYFKDGEVVCDMYCGVGALCI